jgi:hypothetical protein
MDLSYLSTDRFWTKISTANPKVAFLPLCALLLVWGKRFYIQSHKLFAMQKICGSATNKFLVQNSKSNKPPTVHFIGRPAPGGPPSDPGEGPPTGSSGRETTPEKKRCFESRDGFAGWERPSTKPQPLKPKNVVRKRPTGESTTHQLAEKSTNCPAARHAGPSPPTGRETHQRARP